MADKKKSPLSVFLSGLIKDNPIFVQVIGMCPALGVTTSAENGMGMGLATTVVIIASSMLISVIRKFIPPQVRIPSYIVIIASFVTIVQFLLEAYLPELNKSLGLFIPLIVVNCLVLARAESFASKNNPIMSGIDALGMGLGFTLALTILGAVRELLAVGEIFGFGIVDLLVNPLGLEYPGTILFVLPPGAFISLGFIMALINFVRLKKEGK